MEGIFVVKTINSSVNATTHEIKTNNKPFLESPNKNLIFLNAN